MIDLVALKRRKLKDTLPPHLETFPASDQASLGSWEGSKYIPIDLTKSCGELEGLPGRVCGLHTGGKARGWRAICFRVVAS